MFDFCNMEDLILRWKRYISFYIVMQVSHMYSIFASHCNSQAGLPAVV